MTSTVKRNSGTDALRLHHILLCPVAHKDLSLVCFVLDSQRRKCTESNNYGLLTFDNSSCHELQDHGMATTRASKYLLDRTPASCLHVFPYSILATPVSFLSPTHAKLILASESLYLLSLPPPDLHMASPCLSLWSYLKCRHFG